MVLKFSLVTREDAWISLLSVMGPDWYRNEEIETPQGYATDVITQEAISEIKRLNQDDAPFYLHLSYNAPHFGKAWNAVTEETQNVMQPKPNDLIRVEDTLDPLRRSFAAKVVGLDTSIGQVLEVLDRLGIADQTLVIFMTDHALRWWNSRSMFGPLAGKNQSRASDGSGCLGN